MNKAERRYRLISRLRGLGFTYEEANQLRRIEMTLQRWGEGECGDSNEYCSTVIERDEATQKPYRVIMYHSEPPSKARRIAIPDREAGALARLTKLVTARNERINGDPVCGYHQGDPRGCCLYIVRLADLNGGDIDGLYTRGIAVCD